ncbi:MAG: stage IV sporulation protein A [Clostridia bacterium]|nr:stage IV sporulation protein A [Clostridia bacterium]
MQERNIYKDISKRTNGEIYIGVVGPVRTGKSTFIKKFMDELIIPNIKSDSLRDRTIDELPQSASGKTIMTTEPKFVPEEAIEININSIASFKVRMIDCVGFIIPGSLGYIENERPRMIKTPWFEEEIPFDMAAEIGTQKVIKEHSTIGVLVTTDASISDIGREDYKEAEERTVNELKSINKPFVILLNCIDPTSKKTIALAKQLKEKYNVGVIPVNCLELNEMEIKRILAGVLFEFRMKEIKINMPQWLSSLESKHWLREAIFSSIKNSTANISKIKEIETACKNIKKCEYIESCDITNINLGEGKARINIKIDHSLFYKVLGEKTGFIITNDNDLLNHMMNLAEVKNKYSKISKAYDDVLETGYGIVMPSVEELTLEEPQIVKQSGKYGIRLRAAAPSIHMMKTRITTEVTPIVGSEEQSEELVLYLLKEFEENPLKIWESNIFGKSLHELVNEGLHNKLYKMPEDARLKVKETIERIINDGCNGLICIIL